MNMLPVINRCLDCQITSTLLAARATREAEAKARFKEMEASIATSEEHLANLELMAVQTPELMGMER